MSDKKYRVTRDIVIMLEQQMGDLIRAINGHNERISKILDQHAALLQCHDRSIQRLQVIFQRVLPLLAAIGGLAVGIWKMLT